MAGRRRAASGARRRVFGRSGCRLSGVRLNGTGRFTRVLRGCRLIVQVKDFLALGGVDGVAEADEPGVVGTAELGHAGHAEVAVLEAEAGGADAGQDEVLDVLLLEVLGHAALDEVLVVVGIDEASEVGDAVAPVIADAADIKGGDPAVGRDVAFEPGGNLSVGGVDVADAVDGDRSPGGKGSCAGAEHDDSAEGQRPLCGRCSETLEDPNQRDEKTGKDKEEGERLVATAVAG